MGYLRMQKASTNTPLVAAELPETLPLEEVSPISHERVAKNTLIYIVGQLVSWAMTFISVAVIPRRLGEAGMGQLAIAGTAVGAVANMMMLGLDGFISAEIGRNRPSSERIVQAFMGLRLSLLPFLALGALAALRLAHVSPIIWQIGAITLVSASVSFVFAPLRAVLMGWEEARPISVFTFIMGLAPLLAIPFLAGGPVAYSAVTFVGGLPATLAIVLAIRGRVRLRPRIDPATWRFLIMGSSTFLVTEFVAQFYDLGSVFILRHFTDEAAVGVYSQAVKLLGTFLFLPTAVGYALLPSLTRLADADRETFARLQQRVFGLMAVLAMPIAVLALMLAHPFCHLLYGGEKFRSLPVTVQFCALNLIPLYITMLMYRFLIAQRRNAIWSLFMLGTVLLNAGLCWLLIPLTLHSPWLRTGTVGAIVAAAIAETCTACCAMILLKVNPLTRDNALRIAGGLAASGAMAGVMWLTRDWFFGFRGALGLIAFSAVAWKLRALGQEEQAQMASIVRSKIPARFRSR